MTNERLSDERAFLELRIWANEVIAAYDNGGDKGAMANAVLGIRGAYEDALRSPSQGEVGVKPLEWHQSRNGDWHADSKVGQYSVGVVAGYTIAMLRSVRRGEAEDLNVGVGRFDNDQEAKVACFADYSARILSAIHPAPKVGEISDEMVERFGRAFWGGNWQRGGFETIRAALTAAFKGGE